MEQCLGFLDADCYAGQPDAHHMNISGCQAAFANLIANVFITTGENSDDLDHVRMNLDLAKATVVDKPRSGASFNRVRCWMNDTLEQGNGIVYAARAENRLLASALELLRCMINGGFYKDAEDLMIISTLKDVLDESTDSEFAMSESSRSAASVKTHARGLAAWREHDRYEMNADSLVVAEVKFKALECLELLVNLEFNREMMQLIRDYTEYALPLRQCSCLR